MKKKRSSMARETYAQLLADLVDDFGGSKKFFADLVGITPSALSHFLHPTRYTPPPGIETCLRIATAGRCSATRVLQSAGKAHVAALLEALYGKAAERRRSSAFSKLTPEDRQHCLLLRMMTAPQRRAFFDILAGVSKLQAPRSPARRRPARRRLTR